MEEYLQEYVKSLPPVPGAYLFRDKEGRVIYVGKAKNLKKRVSSYFLNKQFENNKLRVLVKQIRKIDHIVVDTESDALLLENNLIKEYQPRYNVLLKDDKSFPYICIKNEPFPRIFSTRNPVRDGSVYFGPYTSVHMVRTILDLIRQIYPLRNCNYFLSRENIESGKFKVCLEYHIGNCKGPCVGLQSEEDYNSNIQQIKSILKGNIHSVKALLKTRMEYHSRNFEYEEAQSVKDKLDILEKYQSKSTIVNPAIKNLDVFSFIDNEKLAVANFVKVINGAVIQSQTIEIKKVLLEDKADLLALVITEIRSRGNNNPDEVVVPFMPAMTLSGLKFTVPEIGDKKRLLDLSTRNARYYLKEKEQRQTGPKPLLRDDRILEKVRQDLKLEKIPCHIECFDNSNIQGKNPVSACVVFKKANPSKSEYRHYNIRTVSGPDDYASMKEVIYRRYKRLIDENSELPQLIIVDGGKAQLKGAVESLESLGLTGEIKVIAIAKKLEEIFLPGDPVPVYLDKKSETLKLIQHLRNEAHRFSLMFHRQKRSSDFARSVLESVPGLGSKTIERLYKQFKTFDIIESAGFDELANVIGNAKARVVRDYFDKITVNPDQSANKGADQAG
jgi:excinuclease ABC subunit C